MATEIDNPLMELAGKLLRQEGRVELTLRGCSMLPTLPGGVCVTVTPTDRERLRRGDLLVCCGTRLAVLHRLLEVREDGALLVTRGDRLERADAPVAMHAVLGQVAAIALPNGRRLCTRGLVWRLWNGPVYAAARLACRLPRPWRGRLWRLAEPLYWRILGGICGLRRTLAPPRRRPQAPPAVRTVITKLAPDAMVQAHAGQLSARDVDGTWVVPPGTTRLFFLNAVGTRLWEICRRPRRPAELRRCLERAYPHETPAALSADLDAFLAAMLDRGILQVRRAAANTGAGQAP